MTALDWTIALSVLGLGGPLLIWAINKVISERLMEFSDKISVRLDSIQSGLKSHVDTQIGDIRESMEDLGADMTKMAADMAVLAVRVKNLEDDKPKRRT